MSGYEITTAHNVTLRFGYASVGDRVLAYILDNLIKVGYILACVFIGSLFTKVTGSGNLPIIFFACAAIIPFIFYSLFFEYYMGGQTPGKRAMKIKVTSEDSNELTFGKCLIRWLFRFVDFNMGSGAVALITVAVTKKKQRVGDMVAGTIVITLKTEKTLDQTIYAHVESNKQARYPQAARLSAHEIEVIKEVVRQYQQGGNYDLIPKTAERVRAAINGGTDQDDLNLLKTVINDYYILASQ